MTVSRDRKQPASRLVLFDLDGTLIPGTSTTLFLADQLGHLGQVARFEQRYREGEITNSTVAVETGALLKGVLFSDIESLFQKAPKIANIDKAVTHLRRSGCAVILGSITWSFFVELFARRFGFDDYCGTEMECIDGMLTGRVTNICTELDKLSFFLRWRKHLNIPRDQTVAIGDSRSDHPVFQESGVAIALNADAATREMATISLDTHDLMDVARLIA